jgi:hypothetical protein
MVSTRNPSGDWERHHVADMELWEDPCPFRDDDRTEKMEVLPIRQDFCDLRVTVADKAVCRFYYSLDGTTYNRIGKEFQATAGTWIGAKAGPFHLNPNISDSEGFSDFEWFRLE